MTRTADRVKETALFVGSTIFALQGALPAYRSFSSAFAADINDKFWVCLEQGVEWEVRVAHIEDTDTLVVEGAPLSSSQDGAEVSWSSLPITVFATLPGSAVYQEAAGIIKMWSGTIASIPSGYVLCNGANGTPDLRDKFVRGAANGADAGATGGAASVLYTPEGVVSQPTFTGDPLANHAHDEGTLVGTADAHTHDEGATIEVPGGIAVGEAWNADNPSSTASATGVAIAGSVSAESAGTPGGTVSQPTFNGIEAAIATLPPYFAVLFIMKT